MSSVKRKCFTIEEKSAILHRLEAGESNATLAKEFGVSHSTISTIKKNKDKIEPLFNANVLKCKRIRTSTHEQVDKALLQWFKLQRDRGIPINGPLLQEKANFFARQLDIQNFTCSMSWINRFKVRHNIVGGKIAGECLSVHQSDVTDWLEKVWPTLRAQFTDDEIFNADETGLFYKLTPDKTLKFRGEKCKGGKLSKERITVMVAANMSGTVKKKLLVIGKSQRPRCFKNVRHLPVDYESNRRAWMTADIFTKWVRAWDRELTKKNKKILLLVDNCPAHPHIADLKSITLVFLPPNTTSVLQPMDQGIIRALKTHFRKNLVLKMIQLLDGCRSTSFEYPKITVLDGILMIQDAWTQLKQITIFNCYKHAGFVQSNVECTITSSNADDFNEEDDVPLSVWARAINGHQLPITNEDFEQYAFVDDAVATCEEPTDENIVENIIATDSNTIDSDGDDGESEEIHPTVSVSEALKAAETLSVFVQTNLDDDLMKTMMSRIHNAVRSSYYRTKVCQKQTQITDFLRN
ncbi:tigger transposable element-derived protein 4-like [Helicoverpa armigera]|uniref:tigger transposable element-derived protein 4-like n=1 Tax=Helicoverpa armigera TaxID=29058 RepID=UPI003082BEB5